ncbi:MAG TPA: FAD-binding protein, partial [Nitrolancea sp.]|nr:FAD-binding protein [Nitrolancea sp.]
VYAPNLKDLASRDVCSRSIYQEVRAGRGIGGKDYVYLDIRADTINKYKTSPTGAPVDSNWVEKRLPDIIEFARTYLGVDPIKEPMPIQPTAHYGMGGIPTDIHGRVIRDSEHNVVPGLYSAGESACVSVHGANRLGTNSLVDLVVFGRRAGKQMVEFVNENEFHPLPKEPEFRARAEVSRFMQNEGHENAADIRVELQDAMMNKVGMFRNADDLVALGEKIDELRNRYTHVGVRDKGKTFNMDLVETLETGFLLDISQAIATSALAREESRGAHVRDDFPDRDDVNWLKHTLAYRTSGGLKLRYKPVVLTRFEPKERKY